MKKIFVGICVLLLALSIAGCVGGSRNSKINEETSTPKIDTPANTSSLTGLEKTISESDNPSMFYYFWNDIKKVCDKIENAVKQGGDSTDYKFNLFDEANIPRVFNDIDTSKISDYRIFSDYKKYEVTVKNGKAYVEVDGVLFYPIEGGSKTVQELTEKYE